MIYFVIGFYLLFLAFKYDVYGSKNESAKKFHYYFALIILILLAGLRYRIGGDTCRYMDLYGTDLGYEAEAGRPVSAIVAIVDQCIVFDISGFYIVSICPCYFFKYCHFFFF